jgi:hypothetical protein
LKIIEDLLEQLRTDPQSVEFEQIMAVIAECYDYHPTGFCNGLEPRVLHNRAGENEGSCKIFAFAQLHKLTQAQTLACFGRYYREDVLANPESQDHANIRNFIRFGWTGIQFDAPALTQKAL